MMKEGCHMTGKEKLYYLLVEFQKGNYDIRTFCDQFSEIFELETNYDSLNKVEYQLFNDLETKTARFSEFEEDLKIPNVYFSAEQVKKKINEVLSQLSIK